MAYLKHKHEDAGHPFRPLTPPEYERVRRLAYDHFGLDLRSSKQELVSARLGKRLRKLGFQTYSEYFDYVQHDPTGAALCELIDALTTNYTSFLREPAHFDFLTNTIAPLVKEGREVRIWSAACSTGEEPYSIALTMMEGVGRRTNPGFKIVATDISTRALKTASEGIYPAERLHGLPAPLIRNTFLRGEGAWAGHFRVRPEVRNTIDFRRINLMEPFPQDLRGFLVIFCRNVMIYFDQPTQTQLIKRLVERLEPGGYLLTGHSESLLGGNDELAYVRPSVYRAGKDRGAKTAPSKGAGWR